MCGYKESRCEGHITPGVRVRKLRGGGVDAVQYARPHAHARTHAHAHTHTNHKVRSVQVRRIRRDLHRKHTYMVVMVSHVCSLGRDRCVLEACISEPGVVVVMRGEVWSV